MTPPGVDRIRCEALAGVRAGLCAALSLDATAGRGGDLLGHEPERWRHDEPGWNGLDLDDRRRRTLVDTPFREYK